MRRSIKKIVDLPTKGLRDNAESLQKRAKKIIELEHIGEAITSGIILAMAGITLALTYPWNFFKEQIALTGAWFFVIVSLGLILVWLTINYSLYLFLFKKRTKDIAREIKVITMSDEIYKQALKELLEIDPPLARKLKKYSLP